MLCSSCLSTASSTDCSTEVSSIQFILGSQEKTNRQARFFSGSAREVKVYKRMRYFAKEKGGRGWICSRMAAYPSKAGCYDKNELSRLSSCLGFPGSFLTMGFENSPSLQLQSAHRKLTNNQTVSEKLLQELLLSKHMHSRLEKVFNTHKADYNISVFTKSLLLLRHKRLSFEDISDARISFELYMSEDGGGMVAATDTVLQALKMMDRVISPVRLESEIQKQQAVVDFTSRIQMYEYFDLVIKTVHFGEVEKEMLSLESESDSSIGSNTANPDNLVLPDFHQLLMTNDERVMSYLDQQYRNSLYKIKKVESNPRVSRATSITRAISSSPTVRAMASSNRQREALIPSPQYSLPKARNGRTVFTPEQDRRTVEPSLTNSRTGTRCDRSYPTTSLNSPAQQMFVTSTPTSWTQSRGIHIHISNTPSPNSPMKQTFITNRPASRAQTRGVSKNPSLPKPPSRSVPQKKTASPLSISKSTPVLPAVLRSYEDKTSDTGQEMVVEDLTDTICNVCEKSVFSASSALRMSMTSVTQLNRLKEREVDSPETGRAEGVRAVRTRTPFRPPIVTELDMARHQGLIDNMEWIALRRKRRDPINLRARSRTFT